MIYRIIGRGGSGKTAFILEAIKKAHDEGKECFFLVPEQQNLHMEKELCALLGSEYNMTTELLNFERLPDRIFRENGGIALSRADSKTLSLYTAIACQNAKEKLSTYENSALDKEFTKRISATIERLECNNVTPKSLVSATSLLDEDRKTLREKLLDVGEIYYEYTSLLENKFYDSTSIQKLLYKSLTEKNFFKGKTVFIDGYYNFTKLEQQIVEMIFKGADDTYITVLYDSDEKSGIFDVNEETLRLTEKFGKGTVDIYPKAQRKRTEELSYLEKNVFADLKIPFVSKANQEERSVCVYSCASPFEESEFVAREIIKLTKKGYRYKDIYVAVRDPSIFEGILDASFNRYKIPFYSGEKEELSSKELSSLVLSLLEIAYTDWSTASVLKYASSSFSPLCEKEADLLSIYAESWRIRGKKWHDGEEWCMNPSGYKARLSFREQSMLKTVNAGREKLVFALEGQIIDLRSKNLTVAKGVEAIYNHLIHIRADKALEKKALSLLDSGLDDEAAKISSLWDSIMSILNTLHETAGDMPVSARRLHDLIQLMMDEYKVGTLPSFSDSVEIGNASIMRPHDCKVIFVLGMNDGIFPALPPSQGLFSEAEKEFLKAVGIESETLSDDFLKNEFLLFYNLCAAPSDKMIMTYSETDSAGKQKRPSLFIDTIIDFFGKDCEKKYIKKKKEKSEDKAIKAKETFSENVFLPPKEPPILKLSASKIEEYLRCPFSYYCKYILGLEKFEKVTLSPAEKGTYFHSILEHFARSLFEGEKFKSKTPEEIKAFFEEHRDKYKESVFHGKTDERQKYSFDSHEEIIIPLLQNLNDEFANSGFVPVEFEEKTQSEYEITEKTKASLSGKADRIDIFEKDGEKFVRVIDYKTGNKNLTENDVRKGFEMQMLTYLFSKCENGETPAGALYFLCGMPSKTTGLFSRKGFMLDSPVIKNEMKYLTDNKYFGSRSFKKSEIFDELKECVSENIKAVGKNIIDGKMESSPEKSKNPCKYCQNRIYCRKKLAKEKNND